MEKQGWLGEFILNFAFIYKQLKMSLVYRQPERAPGSLLFSHKRRKRTKCGTENVQYSAFCPAIQKYIIAIYQIVLD